MKSAPFYPCGGRSEFIQKGEHTVADDNKWYKFYKNVLIGPFLHVYNRPWIEGVEKIPATGPAILASNHQAVMDSFFLPLLCPRQITFPAKAEYFTAPGIKGRLKRFFFEGLNEIPVNRTDKGAGEALLEAATKVYKEGNVLGIYPEGTRSPDGRIYKGKTGMARVALETNQDVIPVAMIDSRKANPIGTVIPRPFKTGIRIGDPINAVDFVKSQGLDPASYEARRVLTDHVMHILSDLTGQPYVDMYAADVKKSLEAGLGYPEGAK